MLGNYSWSKVAQKGNTGPRAGHSMSLLNSKNAIYVFGGTTGNNAQLAELLQFDIGSKYHSTFSLWMINLFYR